MLLLHSVLPSYLCSHSICLPCLHKKSIPGFFAKKWNVADCYGAKQVETVRVKAGFVLCLPPEMKWDSHPKNSFLLQPLVLLGAPGEHLLCTSGPMSQVSFGIPEPRLIFQGSWHFQPNPYFSYVPSGGITPFPGFANAKHP